MFNIKAKCEWFFEVNGECKGPYSNFITTAGLEKIATDIENISSPYLVVGDDTADGETINEVFRKAVSTINRAGNIIRFRTQLMPTECNGNFEKASIFYGATETAGTGTMFNLLKKSWNKTVGAIVTIEARITVMDGGV